MWQAMEARLLSEVNLFMDPIVSPFPVCHRASKRKFSPAQKCCLISVDTGRVWSSSSGKLEFNGEWLSERNWDIFLCFSCCRMLHDFQLLNGRAIHSPNICWVIGWCFSLVFLQKTKLKRVPLWEPILAPPATTSLVRSLFKKSLTLKHF